MLQRVFVAFLTVASPALAQDAAPTEPAAAVASEAPRQAFKTKRVCRSVEVVGSSIPRTTCTTKRIPIEPKAPAPDRQSSDPDATQEPGGGE